MLIFAPENKNVEQLKHAQMKKLILLVLVNLFIIGNSALASTKNDDLKEGDIVFQISKSKQSPAIQLATFSLWSHCGIIVIKNDKPYVLEASNVVKLTDFTTWRKRGRCGAYHKRRVLKDCPKIKYKKYLGQPYDLAFKFNNGKMYCSELVYTIYKNQLGVQLCKPRKVSSYHIFGLSKILKRRHIDPDQLVVAPSDLI